MTFRPDHRVYYFSSRDLVRLQDLSCEISSLAHGAYFFTYRCPTKSQDFSTVSISFHPMCTACNVCVRCSMGPFSVRFSLKSTSFTTVH